MTEIRPEKPDYSRGEPYSPVINYYDDFWGGVVSVGRHATNTYRHIIQGVKAAIFENGTLAERKKKALEAADLATGEYSRALIAFPVNWIDRPVRWVTEDTLGYRNAGVTDGLNNVINFVRKKTGNDNREPFFEKKGISDHYGDASRYIFGEAGTPKLQLHKNLVSDLAITQENGEYYLYDDNYFRDEYKLIPENAKGSHLQRSHDFDVLTGTDGKIKITKETAEFLLKKYEREGVVNPADVLRHLRDNSSDTLRQDFDPKNDTPYRIKTMNEWGLGTNR